MLPNCNNCSTNNLKGANLSTTLDQIQKLSNERQALWRTAGKCKLTDDQRYRLKDLDKRLIPNLWHAHRSELAYAARHRSFDHDRVHGDLFCDYIERVNGARMSSDDWEEVGSVVVLKPEPTPIWAEPRVEIPQQSNIDDIASVVLREVLAELRLQDRALDEARRKVTAVQLEGLLAT